MQQDALANVYARAIFELASEAGGRSKIEEINDELEQIVELARADARFGRFLASPIIDRTARRNAIQSMFHGRVTDLSLRFLLLLNDKGRLNRVESIAAAYDQRVQEAFGRIEVDVFTASVIGDETKRIIADRIHAALGKQPVLHTYSDPHMIGGIKLRIGDQLIDGSVQTKLRKMRQNLLGSATNLRSRTAQVIDEETE